MKLLRHSWVAAMTDCNLATVETALLHIIQNHCQRLLWPSRLSLHHDGALIACNTNTPHAKDLCNKPRDLAHTPIFYKIIKGRKGKGGFAVCQKFFCLRLDHTDGMSGFDPLCDMLLNGKELVLGENDELPCLCGKTVPAGSVEVAPGGCTFIVL